MSDQSKNTLYRRCTYFTSVHTRCLILWSVVFSLVFFYIVTKEVHPKKAIYPNRARMDRLNFSQKGSIPLCCGKVGRKCRKLTLLKSYQYNFEPAGMWSSTINKWRSSLPSFWLTALMTMPQESMPIIFFGGRLVMAMRVLPMSSSGS